MKYLFCYDITSPKRLVKMMKLMESHGIRVQKSLFCCDAGKLEVEDLISSIKCVIDKKKDRVTLYPICEKCFSKIITKGSETTFTFPSYYII